VRKPIKPLRAHRDRRPRGARTGYFCRLQHNEASPVIASRQTTPVALRLLRILRAASAGQQRAEERISRPTAVPLALKRLFCDAVRLPGDDCC